MAEIRPFRALRYNTSKVRLEDVLTQPYDKITPAMQQAYYDRTPHNLVRFELGKPEPGDNEQSNVYSRARDFVAEQLRAGALVRDDAPHFYAYRQTFENPQRKGEILTRSGFIGLGRLYDYDEGVVFRHEQTLSKPKADRLNLLRTARAHSGQIFMVYEDPACAIDVVLDTAFRSRPPVARVIDEYGVTNELVPVDLPNLPEMMADKRLIIADGHHRYETALNYRNEQRAAGHAEGPHDFVMMTFVNMSAPGLIVLPTHRVVYGFESFDAEMMLSRVREFFTVERQPGVDPEALTAALADAGKEATAFAVIAGDKAYILRGKAAPIAAFLSKYSELERKLDVVVLHKLVLEYLLGISEEAIREQRNVRYYRGAAESIHDVQNGANVAFLLNGVPVKLMADLSYAGKLMPQKSTDFYPKLLSGLTLYSLDESFQTVQAGI